MDDIAAWEAEHADELELERELMQAGMPVSNLIVDDAQLTYILIKSFTLFTNLNNNINCSRRRLQPKNKKETTVR